MMIVWRIRRAIIITVLCCVVYVRAVVHNDTHTHICLMQLLELPVGFRFKFSFCVFVRFCICVFLLSLA